jgi:hypothetical protein
MGIDTLYSRLELPRISPNSFIMLKDFINKINKDRKKELESNKVNYYVSEFDIMRLFYGIPNNIRTGLECLELFYREINKQYNYYNLDTSFVMFDQLEFVSMGKGPTQAKRKEERKRNTEKVESNFQNVRKIEIKRLKNLQDKLSILLESYFKCNLIKKVIEKQILELHLNDDDDDDDDNNENVDKENKIKELKDLLESNEKRMEKARNDYNESFQLIQEKIDEKEKEEEIIKNIIIDKENVLNDGQILVSWDTIREQYKIPFIIYLTENIVKNYMVKAKNKNSMSDDNEELNDKWKNLFILPKKQKRLVLIGGQLKDGRKGPFIIDPTEKYDPNNEDNRFITIFDREKYMDLKCELGEADVQWPVYAKKMLNIIFKEHYENEMKKYSTFGDHYPIKTIGSINIIKNCNDTDVIPISLLTFHDMMYTEIFEKIFNSNQNLLINQSRPLVDIVNLYPVLYRNEDSLLNDFEILNGDKNKEIEAKKPRNSKTTIKKSKQKTMIVDNVQIELDEEEILEEIQEVNLDEINNDINANGSSSNNIENNLNTSQTDSKKNNKPLSKDICEVLNPDLDKIPDSIFDDDDKKLEAINHLTERIKSRKISFETDLNENKKEKKSPKIILHVDIKKLTFDLHQWFLKKHSTLEKIPNLSPKDIIPDDDDIYDTISYEESNLFLNLDSIKDNKNKNKKRPSKKNDNEDEDDKKSLTDDQIIELNEKGSLVISNKYKVKLFKEIKLEIFNTLTTKENLKKIRNKINEDSYNHVLLLELQKSILPTIIFMICLSRTDFCNGFPNAAAKTIWDNVKGTKILLPMVYTNQEDRYILFEGVSLQSENKEDKNNNNNSDLEMEFVSNFYSFYPNTKSLKKENNICNNKYISIQADLKRIWDFSCSNYGKKVEEKYEKIKVGIMQALINLSYWYNSPIIEKELFGWASKKDNLSLFGFQLKDENGELKGNNCDWSTKVFWNHQDNTFLLTNENTLEHKYE